jgi:hypothetical protein
MFGYHLPVELHAWPMLLTVVVDWYAEEHFRDIDNGDMLLCWESFRVVQSQ